jgi:PAS domain S-box-containing protein
MTPTGCLVLFVGLGIAGLLALLLLTRRLRKSEARFRLLAENSTDIVCLHDAEGRWLWVSPSVQRVLGHDPKDMIGEFPFSLIHPEDAGHFKQLAEDAKKSGPQGFSRIYRMRRKDGRYLWLETVAVPIREAGRPVLIRTASRDVSQQHRIESLYRFLVEHLPNTSVFLYDRNLQFLLAESSIAWASTAVKGASLHEVFPEDVLAFLEPHFRAALDNRGEVLEEPFRMRSYRIHFLPVNGAAEGISLGMAVFLDVTDEKATLEALQERSVELERSNRDLEQFANVASHELKAPLRRISSFAELLQVEYAGSLSGEADTYLGHITNGVRALQGVIEALLTYSRVQSDRTVMDWVDMDQVYEDAIRNLSPMLAERGAEVSASGLPDLIAGDATLLRQLLENLIGNGVKFNRTGRRPRVRIEAKRGLLDWEFAVRDNGPGLDVSYRVKAFTMFQRFHPEIEGTGVGLALCKKIVGLHRGKIWYDSEPNRGTTFHFTLSSRALDDTTGDHPIPRQG